jgi:ParB family chromosome partitioning protein
MGRKKKELKQLKALPLEAISLRRGISAKSYGAGRIEDMAASLNDAGMRDPILVKQQPGRDILVVVTGGCRLLAARKLGWKTLPALVLDGAYNAEIKLLEALRDDDLTPWDLSDHLHQLQNRLDWTQAHLGQAIGRTRDFVANMLSISQITPETRQFIQEQRNGAELTARHLRYVARAPQHRQMHLARRMLERELSTTALEQGQKKAPP